MKEIFGKMFNEENRPKSIGVICVVLALIIAIVLLIIFNPFLNENEKIKKQLEARLEELGRDYYENYFYDQFGKDEQSKKEFVKGYAQHGIKIDLENLARRYTKESSNIIAEFKNASGEACDTKNSKVSIYPKEPYTNKDYEIEVSLECGFNKDDKKSTTKNSNENKDTTDKPTTTSKTTKKRK